MSTAPTLFADRRGPRDWIYPAIVAAGVLLPTLLSLWFPPRLGNDAATLLFSWNHLVRTGELCRLPVLDTANIAHATSIPLTWWSPGPIWVIGALSRFGLNLGQAISLCVGLAGWTQLAGWRRLYRELGFSSAIASASLILMAASWHTLYSFRNFLGGEVFAAALLPWLALLLRATANAGFAKVFVSFTAAVLIGVFFKLSFLLSAAGLAAGAWLAASATGIRRDNTRPALTYGLALGAALLAAWAVAHVALLSQGASPADSSPVTFSVADMIRRALLPLVLPFSSLVAFTSSGAKLCDALGIAHLSANTTLVVVAAALAVLLHIALWRRAPSRAARAFVAGVSAVTLAGFAFLYLRGAAVGFEDRLFVPCGWFLLPGLLALGWETKGAVARIVVGTFVAFSLAWGIGSYVFRVRELALLRNTSARGYSLTSLPATVEQAVRQADQAISGGDALFLSPKLECLLAVEHHRAVKLPNGETTLSGRPRGGLVVVLPPELPAPVQLARFAEYPPEAWQVRSVAQWKICIAADSRPPSSPQ